MMNKKIWISIVVVAVLILAGLMWYLWGRGDGSHTSQNPDKPVLVSGMTGLQINTEAAARRPLGVVVENHPDARPQSGLDQADLVYEYLAEGGITRYLAIFQSQEPEKIGPVRSGREYSAEIADAWGALYAHVGGSPQVIDKLQAGFYDNLIDLNEFSHAPEFWREKTRYAPHNAYTSYNLLSGFLKKDNKDQWLLAQPIEFSGAGIFPLAGEGAPEVKIGFSKPNFATSYSYDPVTSKYQRFVAGKPDVTLEGASQEVNVVVAQYAKVVAIAGDEAARVDVDWNKGSGKAVVFYKGQAYTAAWRGSDRHPELFVRDGSSRITLPAGRVWWAIVPDDEIAQTSW